MANKALVLGAATIGGVMIYSGIAGVSVMDVLAGEASLKGLDPRGGKGIDIDALLKKANADVGNAIPLIPLGSLGPGPSKTNAKEAVEWAAGVGARHGLEVISAHRPGDPKDHGGNDANRAARDLSNTENKSGSSEQEAAVREILGGFKLRYPTRGEIIKTVQWGQLRVQIIYRTPKYGGHIGHIHIGARNE